MANKNNNNTVMQNKTMIVISIIILIGIFVFPSFIEWLKKFKLTQKIRDEGMSGGAAKLFKKLHLHKTIYIL